MGFTWDINVVDQDDPIASSYFQPDDHWENRVSEGVRNGVQNENDGESEGLMNEEKNCWKASFRALKAIGDRV